MAFGKPGEFFVGLALLFEGKVEDLGEVVAAELMGDRAGTGSLG